MSKTAVAVLISGSGSNLQALIDACADEDFPARIALVISNKPDAYGLERAKTAGIPTLVIAHTHYPDREQFDAALHAALLGAGAEFVCLAGFMRLLTAGFVEKWEDRMINIHPSLLPAFKGGHAVRDAIEYGVKITGCTVHYVVPEMDSGPIIAQAAVAVHPDDTEESLAGRIHEQEHRIYPHALKMAVQSMVILRQGG